MAKEMLRERLWFVISFLLIVNFSEASETIIPPDSQGIFNSNKVKGIHSINNGGFKSSEKVSFATNKVAKEKLDVAGLANVLANIAPEISGIDAAALSYKAGDGKAPLAEALTISDADNTAMQSAEVKFISGYKKNEDELFFETPEGINSSWNKNLGLLKFSGEAVIDNYQSVLRSVSYENTAKKPSASDRVIEFKVNDGIDDSNSQSKTITIQKKNVSATILENIEPADLDYPEKPVNVTSTLTVTNNDVVNLQSAKVSISEGYHRGEDILSFQNSNVIQPNWDEANGTLILSGETTVANYETALREVTYDNQAKKSTPGKRSVSFEVDDGSQISNKVSRNINVNSINTVPVISDIESKPIDYNNGEQVNVSNTLKVTDDDPTLQSAEIKIAKGYVNGKDILSFTDANSIKGKWNGGNGTLSLTGEANVADYQDALRNVQYSNNARNPGSGERTVSFKVKDAQSESNEGTRIIKVTAANQEPVLDKIEIDPINYTGKTAITDQISIIDDNPNLQSATITISKDTYKNGEDVLSFNDKNGITGTWDAGNGTLSLSGDASIDFYQTALRSVQFENTIGTSATAGTRTISFVVNDGSLTSNSVSRDITITHINQAPALGGIEKEPIAYTGKTAVTSSITVSDPENDNIQSATITISKSSYKNGEDVLSFSNDNIISGSWDAVNGTLTLTGDATLTNYETALRNVQFENSKGTEGTRTISFVVNDGSLPSNTVSRDITITHTNQAPVLGGIEKEPIAYTGKTAVTSTITVGDPDNTTLQSATVTVSGGYKNGEDVLSFANSNSISGAWDAATGILTLSGDATLANYQTALRNVQFENTKGNNAAPGARTITFVVNDGALPSNSVSRDITITHINQAPALADIETDAVTYSTKTAVTSTITVGDPDNTTLQSATVTVSGGYKNGEDVLSFANTNSISGAWNAAKGVLTLSGDATLANYQTALQNVQFENTKGNNAAPGARTITFVVNDGALSSNSVSRDITITHINQAPSLAGIEPDALTYSTKTAVTSTITVGDPDNANLKSATISITNGYKNGEDVLSFANSNSISGAWDAATGILTLSGDATLANYQTALRNVQFENTKGNNAVPGTRTITFVVNDGALPSNSASRDINITHINQAPALAGIETDALTYSTKTAVTSTITVSDPDNANLQSATISITNGYKNGEDVLSYSNANGISGTWDAATGTLTLTGDVSLANYQSALRSIQFENTKGSLAIAGTRTITILVNDGALPSNAQSRDITITHINQAPALAGIETDALTYSTKTAVTSTITVGDPDNANLKSATISITNGYKNGEDVLSFTNANGISGSWDAATGTLTLSGESSFENYQAALRTIQYENTNSNPAAETKTISFQVSDGSLTSNTLTRNVNTIHENVAPVLANMETSNLEYLSLSDPVNITSALTISDLDNNTLSSAIISISEGYVATQDVLSFASSNNITSSWDASTGTLTLTGVSSLKNYQNALRNIKYVNLNTSSPTTTTRVISVKVNDGETESNILQRSIVYNSTPVASNVTIDGTVSVCQTITGHYTYLDAENDVENHSTFRWLRADSPAGTKTAIPEATTTSYTLTAEDQNKYIFFEVTPQAKTGSIQGTPVLSSATVNVPNSLPTATFTGSVTICEGTTANITLTLTGTPPFNLKYTDGKQTYDLQTSELVNYIPVSKAGTYKAINLKDNLGCEVTNLPSSATILTKPSPDAKITGLNSAYSLRGVAVPLTGSPAGGVFQGNGVVAANNTFNPALAGVENSPHAIVYTYVDPSSGCFDSDTIMVQVIDADASVVGLREQNQYCTVDVPSTITGINISGNTGTFSISGGVGLTDYKNNTATLNSNALAPGNYTITYAYTQNGTNQSIVKDITVNRVDDVTISGLSAAFCSGSGLAALTSNYQGTFEGNGVELSNGTYYFNPKNTNTGTNNIIFKFNNSLGCIITDTAKVKILPSTKPAFNAASSCWNNTATAFVNSTAHPDSVSSWKWIFGDSASSENTSATKNASHIFSAAGDYSVQLITLNLNNCADTLSQTVHLGTKPLVDMDWEKLCPTKNESLHIRNTTISEDEIQSYRWTVQDATGNLTSFNTKEITQNFRWDEKYTIKLKMNTVAGCVDSVSRNLYLSSPYILRDSSYSENFEKAKNSWYIESNSGNNWTWNTPIGTITQAHSPTKTMYTQFSGARNSQQLITSSPCFDFTGIDRPFIEMWINSAVTGSEEGAVLQYRTEDLDNWITVGNMESGVNWYNSNSIASLPDGTKTGWSGNTNGWVKALNAIDSAANKKTVKFRMIYKPLQNGNAANIFAFDDVAFGSRQRTSLFEHFTNLSANSALVYTQDLNKVLAQTQKDVVNLEYHTSFPGTDTLNAANTADPGARVLHYGIGQVPYGILNGGTNASLIYDFATHKPSVKDMVAQSFANVPYLLSITSQKEPGVIKGKVLITSNGNFSNQSNALYIAVVEDVIVQSGNSQVTLYNVVKKLLPSAGGTPLNTEWTQGQQVEVPFSWNFYRVYNPNKVKIIAFIQSSETKEVLQAAFTENSISTATPVLIEKPETDKVVIAPNPASDYARIIFPTSIQNDIRLEIYNMNGKLMKIDNILKGVDVYSFDVNDLINGLYFIKLTGKDASVNTYKLIITR